MKEKKLTGKKLENNFNDNFNNIFKNLSELNDPSSIKKPIIENKDHFYNNYQYSNLKKKENEASTKILEIMQKNYPKELGAIKTTPDNLSSKRNRKGHISPIDFPSSRNKKETLFNYQQKNANNNIESSNNNNNLLSEERYRIPSTNPHKYKENPLFSNKNDDFVIEKIEKGIGKKNLYNLLQEKNSDFNEFVNKNQNNNNNNTNMLNKNFHTKNDSSSNSSYLSYLQKNHEISKNNKTNELLCENEKIDNIQSSPRKFNRNLNEVIIDITKRCQTSSNSNLQKAEKALKERSLEKNNIMDVDLKNKHKDPILPKPRNSNEKGQFIGKEDNFNKYPYLCGGQNRRSSLNIENEQKRALSIKPVNEILNSSKKERSKSILSEKYTQDD